VPKIEIKSVLDPYRETIIKYLTENRLFGVLIHRNLVEYHDVNVTYSCVKKYLRKLKCPGLPYVPLVSPPGEEVQVDFGYAGYFYDDDLKRRIKIWVFCMVLSNRLSITCPVALLQCTSSHLLYDYCYCSRNFLDFQNIFYYNLNYGRDAYRFGRFCKKG